MRLVWDRIRNTGYSMVGGRVRVGVDTMVAGGSTMVGVG